VVAPLVMLVHSTQIAILILNGIVRVKQGALFAVAVITMTRGKGGLFLMLAVVI
jgi:hypothetical protein